MIIFAAVCNECKAKVVILSRKCSRVAVLQYTWVTLVCASGCAIVWWCLFFFKIEEAVPENMETVFEACISLLDNAGYKQRLLFGNRQDAIRALKAHCLLYGKMAAIRQFIEGNFNAQQESLLLFLTWVRKTLSLFTLFSATLTLELFTWDISIDHPNGIIQRAHICVYSLNTYEYIYIYTI